MMSLFSLVNGTVLLRDELLLTNRTAEGFCLSSKTLLDVILICGLVTDEALLAVSAGEGVNSMELFGMIFQGFCIFERHLTLFTKNLLIFIYNVNYWLFFWGRCCLFLWFIGNLFVCHFKRHLLNLFAAVLANRFLGFTCLVAWFHRTLHG